MGRPRQHRGLPPRRWRILLGVALLVASPAAAAVTLSRGPYLQLLTTHSVTVVWDTNTAAACSLAIRPVDGDTTVITGGTSTLCAIAVEGLVPGARYAYVPRANGVPLTAESVFRADTPTLPFRFLVVGDSGGGNAGQRAVGDRMVKTPADFILSTGDMIYESGAAADFDPKFFIPYRNLLRRLVFWPCLGNHDVATTRGQPWRDAFYTPANNAAGSENYYSFDHGNAHVAVLDSNASTKPGSAQYTFLAQDLATSQATWKFVAFHHTIYTIMPTTSIRTNLVPLFDREHVDVVFMGHLHSYERTKPLRANKVVAPGSGTIYVTTGGGGRSLGATGRTSVTAYAESSLHFTRVAVDGETLVLQMIRSDGAVRDSLTLVKAPGSPTTSTSTTSVTVTTTSTTTTVEALPGTTTTTLPSATLVFAPVADAYVDAGSPGTNFGIGKTMSVDASPVRITYLRFLVSGVGGRPVTRAILRLTADSATGADSVTGGRVHRIGDLSWQERAVTYGTRPAIDGPVLATLGRVDLSGVVDFDVTGAVTGDGGYSLALETASADGVRYLTREATSGTPELLLTLGPAAPAP